MTERKVYIGSAGPFLYDDTDLVADEDGDFPGQYFAGITAEQVQVTEIPVLGTDVLRYEDIIGFNLADRAMAYYFGVM